MWNCWTGALAHLGVARANALQARTRRGGCRRRPRPRARRLQGFPHPVERRRPRHPHPESKPKPNTPSCNSAPTILSTNQVGVLGDQEPKPVCGNQCRLVQTLLVRPSAPPPCLVEPERPRKLQRRQAARCKCRARINPKIIRSTETYMGLRDSCVETMGDEFLRLGFGRRTTCLIGCGM